MNKLRFVILLLLSVLILISGKLYPALSMGEDHNRQNSLNGVIHTFHSGSQIGEALPQEGCHGCHPGPQSETRTNVLDSLGIGCLDCHPGMASMNAPQNFQGVALLSCTSCHEPNLIPSELTCDGGTDRVLSGNDRKVQVKPKAENTHSLFCTAPGSAAGGLIQPLNGDVQAVQNLGFIGGILTCTACHPGDFQKSIGHFVFEQ